MSASDSEHEPAVTSFDAADLLWRNEDIFDERHAKSASALIAVARVLGRHRPLAGGEDEFLALYAEVAAMKPALFTQVWTDPSAYFWVRMAYQLVAACVSGAPLAPLGEAYRVAVGAGDPQAALAIHLDRFKLFVLGLRFLGRSACRFASPFRAALPLAIPGTGLSLEGEGEVVILGLARRRLEIARRRADDGEATASNAAGARGGETMSLALTPGRAIEGVTVVAAPEVGHAGASLAMQPALFAQPGLDFAAPVLAAGIEFQLRHRALVARTLGLMQVHERRTFLQFRRTMRTVGLKPLRSGTYTNITHSDLPGAFIAAVVENPYELADTFIHEFHHNRLFFIEERGAFFASGGDDPLASMSHYSPWRDDPRPLHGLFHAVYVTIPVVRFWLDAYIKGALDVPTRGYAVDRILRGAAQLDLGVAELERAATFSAFGRALFEQMKTDVAELHHLIGCEAGLPSDAPALTCREDGAFEPEVSKLTGKPLTVCAAVAEHEARFAPVAASDPTTAPR